MALVARCNRFAVRRAEAIAGEVTGLEMRLTELDARIAAAWAASADDGRAPVIRPMADFRFAEASDEEHCLAGPHVRQMPREETLSTSVETHGTVHVVSVDRKSTSSQTATGGGAEPERPSALYDMRVSRRAEVSRRRCAVPKVKPLWHGLLAPCPFRGPSIGPRHPQRPKVGTVSSTSAGCRDNAPFCPGRGSGTKPSIFFRSSTCSRNAWASGPEAAQRTSLGPSFRLSAIPVHPASAMALAVSSSGQ